MLTSFRQLIHKWFPGRVDPVMWKDRLAQFYATNHAYHAMTAASGKETHPQVQLLMSMVREDGRYAEIGCGGGAVSRLLGRIATVSGFDVSPIAIAKANESRVDEKVTFSCVEGCQLPLAASSVDGCYSFEVLEHVWDPLPVIREMVRVTKPGGFILISMPNHYSLDLHLEKKRLVRMIEFVLAAVRAGIGLMTSRLYWNLAPDLDGDVYPDCDMVTTLNPMKIRHLFMQLGCRIEFVDSTMMCALNAGSSTPLSFQRNTGRPFVRHFGDHWVILARRT